MRTPRKNLTRIELWEDSQGNVQVEFHPPKKVTLCNAGMAGFLLCKRGLEKKYAEKYQYPGGFEFKAR